MTRSKLDEVKEFWNNNIHDWQIAKSEPGSPAFFREIEEYRFQKLHYLPKVVDFSGYPGKKVLDVGCGVGNDVSRFAKAGSDVTGIDIAEHSIELAIDNFKQRGLSGEFLIMDGENMTFPDNTFDVIYSHSVLHFTPHPDAMVREIHRVLKPGGTAILMTVNRRSWLNLLHKVAKIKIDHLDAPVLHRYSRAEFEQVLAPFDDLKIITERFPVKTKVHGGWKAGLFDTVFVGFYNLMPRSWVRRTGHHLLAFGTKAAVPAPTPAPTNVAGA